MWMICTFVMLRIFRQRGLELILILIVIIKMWMRIQSPILTDLVSFLNVNGCYDSWNKWRPIDFIRTEIIFTIFIDWSINIWSSSCDWLINQTKKAIQHTNSWFPCGASLWELFLRWWWFSRWLRLSFVW